MDWIVSYHVEGGAFDSTRYSISMFWNKVFKHYATKDRNDLVVNGMKKEPIFSNRFWRNWPLDALARNDLSLPLLVLKDFGTWKFSRRSVL